MGREDAVIKSLEDFRPKGVAGVTTLSNGQIVLILDMKELLGGLGENRGVPRSAFTPPSHEPPELGLPQTGGLWLPAIRPARCMALARILRTLNYPVLCIPDD